jgi:hypothetical protein
MKGSRFKRRQGRLVTFPACIMIVLFTLFSGITIDINNMDNISADDNIDSAFETSPRHDKTSIINVPSASNPVSIDNHPSENLVPHGGFDSIEFPIDSFLIPMDDKQNDILKAFGFVHALLRNGTAIHRIIQPPDVMINTSTFPGGSIHRGGPILLFPDSASVISIVQPSFPNVTLDTITHVFSSNKVYSVMDPTNIIVIYGIYGLTNTILDEMEIPYKLISTSDAENNPWIIGPPYNLVVVDCMGWFGYIPPGVASAIRTLVENGGEAMFNCYATQDMIQIFPNYVKGTLIAQRNETCTFHPISEYPAQYYGPTEMNFTDIWSNMESIHSDVRVVLTTDNPSYHDAALYFPYGDNNGMVVATVFEPGHQPAGSDSRMFASILYGNKFVHLAPPPDLAVSESDILFIPKSPVAQDELVTINATIHNIGLASASNVAVRFYDGDPLLGNQIGFDQKISFIRASGGIGYAEVDWVASSIGFHDIYVVVDPINVIQESNETNNVASKTIEVVTILPPTLYVNAYGDDILLNWTQSSTTGLSHYLLYRSESQTGFDFSDIWVDTSLHDDNGTIPLRTSWNDTGAASSNASNEYYYTIRMVFDSGEIGSTSRTVGKWTETFLQGVFTFSLPLEPLEPLTIENCRSSMNADYIKWMDPQMYAWVKHGEGAFNDNDMKLGEGYEVKFSSSTKYTFCGMPAAMIIYNEVPFGFDSNLLYAQVNETSNTVTLTWSPPISMGPGYQYHVLRSHKRDGFWGGGGTDYEVLAVLPFETTSYEDIGRATPDTEYYYMVVPVKTSSGEKGRSTYSIGIWSEEVLSQYDTFGIPLKLNEYKTVDWYCDNIPKTIGINYYFFEEQRWGWHSTRMPSGAYDPSIVMTEGYQISTSNITKFIFIGV